VLAQAVQALLQALAAAIGAARMRAALGHFLARMAIVLVAAILIIVALGYLLDAANTALAGVVGPVYAALIMGGTLLAAALALWFAARGAARRQARQVPALPPATVTQIVVAILAALAGILAARPKRATAEEKATPRD